MDEQKIVEQIKETHAYCNNCAWSGKRRELWERVGVGLVCPECKEGNIETEKVYLVTGRVLDSIKYMAQRWWEQHGSTSPTYKTVDNWIESTEPTHE